jgi:hypothetical protein
MFWQAMSVRQMEFNVPINLWPLLTMFTTIRRCQNQGGRATRRKEGARVPLLLDPNHSHRNRPPFPLREFQTRLLRLCFRLERLGQWSELAVDVPEEQPMLDGFGHVWFIARA